MTKKKTSCWLFHRWGRWCNPYTPPGYYETLAIQRRTCERCNATQQRTV